MAKPERLERVAGAPDCFQMRNLEVGQMLPRLCVGGLKRAECELVRKQAPNCRHRYTGPYQRATDHSSSEKHGCRMAESSVLRHKAMLTRRYEDFRNVLVYEESLEEAPGLRALARRWLHLGVALLPLLKVLEVLMTVAHIVMLRVYKDKDLSAVP